VDKVLAMARGQVAAFGSKEEVLKDVLRQPVTRAAQGQPSDAAAVQGTGTGEPSQSKGRPLAAEHSRDRRVIRPTASLRPVPSVSTPPMAASVTLDAGQLPVSVQNALAKSSCETGGVQ
jgi:hypothetical protein